MKWPSITRLGCLDFALFLSVSLHTLSDTVVIDSGMAVIKCVVAIHLVMEKTGELYKILYVY